MAARALRTLRLPLIASLSVLLVLILLASSSPILVHAFSPNVVVSQVYGGGGNSGATLKNDFIELFNRGTSAVDMTGWSVQYASAGGSSWQKTNLAGMIQPGHYYLVQEAQGSGGSVTLPTPDAIGTIPMGATAGKVALVTNQALLTCGATIGSCVPNPVIRDFVGFGSTANNYEGSAPTPPPSNTTAVLRADYGCQDTDNNAVDFAAGAPAPRNAGSPTHTCPATTNPSGVAAPTPTIVDPGDSVLLTVNVVAGTNPTSTGLAVTGNLSAIGGSATQAFYNDGTHGDVTASDSVFSFQATVAPATAAGAKTLALTITDAQSRTGSASIALSVAIPNVPIHNIQGAGHISPMNGQIVSTAPSVVTAKTKNGFYLQDLSPDNNPATSEGVFAFTSSAPSVNVGDKVRAKGVVYEYRPGCDPSCSNTASGYSNLTVTEIGKSDVPAFFAVLSTNTPLPAPVIIGNGGRLAPTTVIEDDAGGNVETGGVFDPASDGVDFYESLEGMRVQVNDALVVGPRADFGSNREVYVVANSGAHAELRTPRGGLLIRSGDFNPERIIFNDLIVAGPTLPAVNVRDQFPGATLGLMDYNFGNYKLEVTQLPTVLSGGLTQETMGAAGASQLAVATFNVENLAPSDPPAKFSRLASLIVNNLRAPDLIAVEEIQDNNGTTNNGEVNATQTWNMLIAAIQATGGPAYQFRQINPVNDQDGGAPGGNIRQGFLFRTDRGLGFIDRPGGTSTAATTVVSTSTGPQLSYSPGRLDPTNPAFVDSRKPLAGEFTFNGHHLFVIANHFNSKGGDQALFGRFQPPAFSSEVQRIQQATVVKNFVTSILNLDPNAEIIVLGDLNDYEFSAPMVTLKGNVLKDLIETLPPKERYTYDYQGNSETLDHILLSNALFSRPYVYKVVHVNSEFADQASDHEPQVVHLTMPKGQTKTK